MSLGWGGCADENLFSDCPLSNSIEEACADQADDQASFTCVVAEHPYCNESICASWLGSRSFCTRACSGAADCPSGSTCETYLETTTFCVPDKEKPSSP